MQKMLLQRRSNRRFTAGRQPREPDGETLLAAKGASFGMCEGRVPCYVPIRNFFLIFKRLFWFCFCGCAREGDKAGAVGRASERGGELEG